MALAAITVASFAQGKITIGNDSLHLLADEGGTPLSQATLATMSLTLMAGTSAGSMTLQTTIVNIGNPAFDAGRIKNVTFNLIGVPTSSQASMQLFFFDTATGTTLTGNTAVFTMTTGAFANNSIVAPGAPSFSTWAAGPVTVSAVPEPTSMALASIGAASLLLFRRRK